MIKSINKNNFGNDKYYKNVYSSQVGWNVRYFYDDETEACSNYFKISPAENEVFSE